MEKRINWSERSKHSFEKVIQYLLAEWSDIVADNFISETNDCIDKIIKHPFIGVESEKRKGARKILLTRHNLLVYKVFKYHIVVLDIIDTRQNPKKSKY